MAALLVLSTGEVSFLFPFSPSPKAFLFLKWDLTGFCGRLPDITAFYPVFMDPTPTSIGPAGVIDPAFLVAASAREEDSPSRRLLGRRLSHSTPASTKPDHAQTLRKPLSPPPPPKFRPVTTESTCDCTSKQ